MSGVKTEIIAPNLQSGSESLKGITQPTPGSNEHMHKLEISSF